jgi:hypothetical protein
MVRPLENEPASKSSRWVACQPEWSSIDGEVSAAFKTYLYRVPWRMLTSAN